MKRSKFSLKHRGDGSVVDDPSKMPQAKYKVELPAKEDGYVSEIVADSVGVAAMWLGAGRATKESEIDLAVGLMLNKKIGEAVKKGDSLVTIYSNQEDVEQVKAKLYESIKVSQQSVEAPPLVHDTVKE